MHPFKEFSWMSFGKCIYSCPHHHNQNKEYFHHPKKFLCSLCSQSPSLDPHQSQELTGIWGITIFNVDLVAVRT